MEIQEQAQAGGLDPAGHRHGLLQAAKPLLAVAALIGGLDKDAETDVIKAVVLEDLQNILLHAVVAEFYAARLGGWDG